MLTSVFCYLAIERYFIECLIYIVMAVKPQDLFPRGYHNECGPLINFILLQEGKQSCIFKLKENHTDIISKYVHVYYHILEHSEHNNLTTTV